MRINKNINRSDNDLIEKISIIVNHSRRGEYSDASSQMNIFLQDFQKYLQSGFIAPDKLNKVAFSLETLLMLQQQEDWIAVADILEYEIAVFLK